MSNKEGAVRFVFMPVDNHREYGGHAMYDRKVIDGPVVDGKQIAKERYSDMYDFDHDGRLDSFVLSRFTADGKSVGNSQGYVTPAYSKPFVPQTYQMAETKLAGAAQDYYVETFTESGRILGDFERAIDNKLFRMETREVGNMLFKTAYFISGDGEKIRLSAAIYCRSQTVQRTLGDGRVESAVSEGIYTELWFTRGAPGSEDHLGMRVALDVLLNRRPDISDFVEKIPADYRCDGATGTDLARGVERPLVSEEIGIILHHPYDSTMDVIKLDRPSHEHIPLNRSETQDEPLE